MNRESRIQRRTNETHIDLSIDLDGRGEYSIATGLGFFDHMLSHIAKHGQMNMRVQATGDLHVDEHHLIEDAGICLGQALHAALIDKRGLERFGCAFVPMDEALARTIVDLSGRGYLVFNAEFTREMINGFPLEMTGEFFRAIASEAKMNLHIALLYGNNAHHQCEAIFKSFGRALHQAVALTGGDTVPSTKGVL